MSSPGHADFDRARGHFVAGNAAFEAGRFADAETLFLASLQALPGRPSTLVNLAAARLRLGRPQDALAPLEQALAAQPGDGAAWSMKGTALGELGRHAEALAALERAIACGAADAGVHHRRGLALAALERLPQAAQAWEQAVALDPRFAAAWADLGALRRDQGQREQALHCLEQALACGADDPLVRFQIAGLREGATAPDAPPRAYVEQLFDGYAQAFDAHLVQGLGYRTPSLLAEGLGRSGRARFERALDLGCGTGLCAAPLQPWVRHLDGVDLSAAMLEKARALGRYGLLEQGDVVEHLQRTARRYDLVVAADVFVYLGALDAVFQGARRVLEPGGVFGFSVEAWDGPGDFHLHATLRYAHGAAYLRRLAQAEGFEMIAMDTHALRQDHGRTIEGLCVWLRAPGEPGAGAGQTPAPSSR